MTGTTPVSPAPVHEDDSGRANPGLTEHLKRFGGSWALQRGPSWKSVDAPPPPAFSPLSPPALQGPLPSPPHLLTQPRRWMPWSLCPQWLQSSKETPTLPALPESRSPPPASLPDRA